MKTNYGDMFNHLHPGFFADEGISSLPVEEVFDEQVLDLHTWQSGIPVACPGHITFGRYEGDLQTLHDAIALVDDDWTQWFHAGDEIFCAYDGDKVVSFCLLDAFGEYDGLRVGGPGCVGTIPAYRKLGIGLRMVQLATEELQKAGYDLSWIHYTHVGHWYARLGYETVVKWNSQGIVEAKAE